MRIPLTTQRHNGDRDERGAALVEFAFVLPLLLTLVIGIVELGLGLRDQLSMSNAVTSAARIGSVMGTDLEADIRILDAVEAGLIGGVDINDVTKVIIYESQADGSSTGNENHYRYNDTDPTCPWDPCPDPLHPGFAGYGSPAGWEPGDRTTALPSPDILGLKIEYTHEWASTLIPFMRTPANWVADARIRLEPDVYGP